MVIVQLTAPNLLPPCYHPATTLLPLCYHPATTQATRDPHTGEPYLTLKAGRPAWEKEFKALATVYGPNPNPNPLTLTLTPTLTLTKALATVYGREDIGVVFCGGSMDISIDRIVRDVASWNRVACYR